MLVEEHCAVPNGEEAEKLSYYPLTEGCTHACVSIGHTDHRTNLYFQNNFDAYLCYIALKAVVEMDIS